MYFEQMSNCTKQGKVVPSDSSMENSTGVENEHKNQERATESFASYTTIHGVHHWMSYQSPKWRRVVYFLAWLVLTGFMLFQLYLNFCQYLKYETKISSNVYLAKSLNFPSITICPGNPWKKSKLEQSNGDLHDRDGLPNVSFSADGSHTHHRRQVQTGLGRHLTHSVEDMLLRCEFEMEEFNCSQSWISHSTPEMALCFTFNHKSPVELSPAWRKGRSAKGRGIYNGLSLLLLAERNQSCSLTSGNFDGFFMTIHEQETIPMFPRDESILLSPGTKTQIALKKSVVDRSATEHLERCVTDQALWAFPNVSYKRQNCMMQCLIEKIWAKCSCLSMYGFLNSHAVHVALTKHVMMKFSNTSIPDPCYYKEEAIICMSQVVDDFRTSGGSQCHQKCPKACKETEYAMQVSSASFPADQMIPYFQKTTKFSTKDGISENLLKVDIFFQTMNYKVSMETRAELICNLMNNIGGTLGIYLGASFVTIIEAIEFLVICILNKNK